MIVDVYINCICSSVRSLHEVSLHESIRYGTGDRVEKWLNELLCLDCLSVPRIISGCPLPQTCELYPKIAQTPIFEPRLCLFDSLII